MQRLFVYLAFAGLLFVLGLTAGRSITDKAAFADGALPRAAASPISQADGDLTVELTTSSGLPMTASLPTLAARESEEFEPVAATLASHESANLATAPDGLAADSVESISTPAALSVQAPDSASKVELTELIRRMIPTADDATVSVWVDSYSGMDLADVEFILEQKRRHNSSLTVTAALSSDLPLSPEKETSELLLKSAVESNLREAMTIGYRRIIVLTEPGSLLPSGAHNSGNVVSFRSFDKGRVISSPVATHVSMALNSSPEMFLLEDGRLTRRGDFRRLSDGTFGLLIAGQEFRVDGSPAGIDASANLRVSESGEVVSVVAESDPIVLARIKVVWVSNLSALSTTDGVVFRDDLPGNSSPVDAVRLRPGSLELSNVNVEEESQLRKIFEATAAGVSRHY